jgi:hypothetical protein
LPERHAIEFAVAEDGVRDAVGRLKHCYPADRIEQVFGGKIHLDARESDATVIQRLLQRFLGTVRLRLNGVQDYAPDRFFAVRSSPLLEFVDGPCERRWKDPCACAAGWLESQARPESRGTAGNGCSQSEQVNRWM